MSSSLPLRYNSLPSMQKSSKTPSEFNSNMFIFPNFSKSTFLSLSKSHICFTFNNNSSNFEREEIRWLREEQRWIREERRWENDRESLLNEIKSMKLQIKELRRVGGSNSVLNVSNLLHVLKKEVNQIAESGSNAAPLAVMDAEEAVVVVKEVIRVTEEVKEKKRTLRVGSDGDQVQMLQNALQKLGFHCGEEDEEFASFSCGTETAVRTWQASVDVPETGIMTTELLKRLFMEQQDGSYGIKEVENGTGVTSVKKDPEPYVSDNRVFLLGENRFEDSSRLINRNSQSQTDSKGVVTTMCVTCCGEGRFMCLECDGTGERNIEPQFLEWVGEDTKCPYCEDDGQTTCDICQGTGVTRA